MATKLPVWANNDLATYSAFQGLPADLTSAAPKKIDPQGPQAKGNPKGMEFVPGGEGDPGTFRVPVATPAGWDPTVKLYANYDSTGNLTGYSGSNPVFPADASGNLSKVKYTPIWDTSGKSVSVQDTSHGGWAGTPIVMAAASMIPGVAPFMAAANVANAIANHQPLSPSTLLGLGISTVGAMGGTPVDMVQNADGTVTTTYSDGTSAVNTPQQGIASPSLGTNLKTASQVIKAGESIKNPAALISSLTNLVDTSPDVKVALNATNAIRAIGNGMPATAIAPYISSIIDSSDPSAVSIATKMLNTILPNSTLASVNSDTSVKDATQTAQAVTTPSVNVDTSKVTDPLAVPTGMTVTQNGTQVNPLDVPNMPVVKPPSATIGNMNEIDLQKLFDQVNSLNPVEDNTIQARQGGSLDDLMHLLNSRG
jgi:hypothetical protein